MSIDPRLIERRKSVAESNAKRSMSRLLKFLAFVVVVGGLLWLAFSPWLSVSQVTTHGIDVSNSHSTLVDHAVVAGTPMILISAAEVEAALMEDPWVAEATVDLAWPDEVEVSVVERTPVAWVETAGGWTRRAVDGVALPSADAPKDGMARIEMPGVADDQARTSGDVLGALEFVESLPEGLRADAVVTRFDGELWATVSGYQVRLGRSTDMTQKALSLDALLDEPIPEGSTLVLIAPTNPAFMTPGSPDGGDDGAGAGTDDAGDAGTGGDEGEGSAGRGGANGGEDG